MNTPLLHSLPWKADQAISGCPIIITNQGDHIANVYCQDDRDYILDCVNKSASLELSLSIHETNMLALETVLMERDILRDVCRRVLNFWEGEPIPKQTPRIAETIGQLRQAIKNPAVVPFVVKNPLGDVAGGGQ